MSYTSVLLCAIAIWVVTWMLSSPGLLSSTLHSVGKAFKMDHYKLLKAVHSNELECGDNSLGFTLLTVDSSLSHFKDSQYCISIFLLCWLARALVVGSVGDNNSCGELHVSTLLLLVVITLQVGRAQSSHTKYKVRQLLIHYHFNEENRFLLLFKWISGWRTKMHF